jgi:hypothetical protein
MQRKATFFFLYVLFFFVLSTVRTLSGLSSREREDISICTCTRSTSYSSTVLESELRTSYEVRTTGTCTSTSKFCISIGSTVKVWIGKNFQDQRKAIIEPLVLVLYSRVLRT